MKNKLQDLEETQTEELRKYNLDKNKEENIHKYRSTYKSWMEIPTRSLNCIGKKITKPFSFIFYICSMTKKPTDIVNYIVDAYGYREFFTQNTTSILNSS